ncbi:carboxylate-amine ligase [Actinacidiphila alni]|uniref:Putative glutamate--cysteine ligase 2 n=1 Tax=Actinacidiphila alni TaxID=380248 RepID=A0A1I2H8X6_9ACTN|nr:glutamate--cysteine ligase [Actinacidiphila alni]SFF25909.1 carboxylate-amine ligase [Actinacidiphila alni]
MVTLGVEEEFFLLDPETGLPVPRVDDVRAAAGLQPAAESREVQEELLQAQIEVATPVCSDLDEVAGHLLRLRHAVSIAAEESGCRLAAVGAAPLAATEPVPVARAERAGATRSRAARLADEQLINGMHVHVGVPDRPTGVAVLNRIRPWLPVLVAMAGNSPVWQGEDTGFASWRTIVFDRWPVSGPPPVFAGPADYDTRIRTLVESGTVLDRGQVYWQARLSDRYPTVEVRALDVQLRTDEAALFAGLVRALVATALREHAASVPFESRPQELVHAATWHAARYGLTGDLVDPDGRRRPAGEVVSGLVDHLTPALDSAGDTRQVMALVHRLLAEGTPAERQRNAFTAKGMPGLLDLITAETVAV